MAVRAARTRSESMAQRLARKPIGEGFDLWDRGYLLGAMRLFIFKAENSPPFLLGPCLDAVAHLLLQIEERDDARENFAFAAEKYELAQCPLLVELMRARVVEIAQGPEAALQSVRAVLLKYDPDRTAHHVSDMKTRTSLGRLYYVQSELHYKCGAEASAGIEDANYSMIIGWDRPYLSQYLIAKHCEAQGDVGGAVKALEKTISMNPNYLAAYEALAPLIKRTDGESALQYLERAIAIHPRCTLLREKVFLMSEKGNDAAALAYLDTLLNNPPLEEADPLDATCSTTCTLLKAKAAILADAGKMDEALEAAVAAKEASPADEEAGQIVEDIRRSR